MLQGAKCKLADTCLKLFVEEGEGAEANPGTGRTGGQGRAAGALLAAAGSPLLAVLVLAGSTAGPELGWGSWALCCVACCVAS